MTGIARELVLYGSVYTWRHADLAALHLQADNFSAFASMPRTRVSGNSQAVRIPAELAYADTEMDLEITRVGDVITIFPARNNLKDAVAALRSMLRPARVEKRQPIEVSLRRRD